MAAGLEAKRLRGRVDASKLIDDSLDAVRQVADIEVDEQDDRILKKSGQFDSSR